MDAAGDKNDLDVDQKACLDSKDTAKDGSNSENSTSGKCEVCGEPSLLFCRNCCVSYYCCRDHQKQAWKKHKSKCYPVQRIQIGTEDTEPKELAVTRNVAQGEVFLKESPILIYPHTSYYTKIVCVECCAPLYGEDKVRPCTGCGWELCSEDCQGNVDGHHKKNECPIFQKWNGKDLAGTLHAKQIDKYFAIGLIRALLLRETKPALWERIQAMNSCRKQREMLLSNHEAVLKAYTSLVHNDCELTNYDENTIDHVLGVLNANSIDIPEDFISKSRPVYKHASILFPLCSEAGRSCIPNARFNVKGRYAGNFQLFVMANVPIPKGSPVSFSTEQGLTGTFIRRAMKKKMFYRHCNCERCKDPTELGTFLSAVKCRRCKDEESYCVQTNPLQESSEWKCTNCGGTLDYREVVCIVEEISSMIQSGVIMNASAEGVNYLMKCLSKLKGSLLHPNHFIIINAELDVCKRFDILSRGKEDMLIEMTKHILSVADVVAPGFSRLRGHILHCLQFAIVSSLMNKANRVSTRKTLKEGVALGRKRLVEECKKYQHEVRKIFETEPEDSEEQLVLEAMKAKMELIS